MLTIIKPEAYNSDLRGFGETDVFTHDGLFHSDDVFSVALLRLFHKDLNIVRTRDAVLLNQAINNPKTFVLDVGMQFNPKKRVFDHHQNDAPSGLSTISLLFFYLFPDYEKDDVLNKLYCRLIKGINAWDQGIADRNLESHPLHLPQLVSAFNRLGNDNQDAQFLKAVDFAYLVLSNEMNTAKEITISDEIWRNKMLLDPQIALLNKHCIFWRSVQEEEKPVKYIIQPDQQFWSVSSVDSNHFPLPVLTEPFNDLVFQHKDRFITIFKNYQSALNYANQFLLKK